MTRRRAEPRCLAFAFAAWAALAQAQQTAPPGGLTVQTRVSLMQSWTDNLRLVDQNKDAALITTVSPGISIAGSSGVWRGSLDYSLNGIAYVKSDEASRVQNVLSANAQAELISRTLFVDVRANIGQQSASAFGLQSSPTSGTQGSVSSLANPNQHETSTLVVSPSLRGRLGGVATYDLRGDFTRTDVRGSSLGDSHGTGGSLRINQANAGLLGWWLAATTQQVKSVSAPANRNSSLTAGLTYRPDLEWSFTANVGQERNNYLGSNTRSGVTSGATAEWVPTPRTRIGADFQRHEYGNSHALNFEHRMARSVWRYSDTQSTMIGNTGASGGVRTVYDQFFLLFTSLEPDPVKRDVYVRNYLQSQGLSPDAVVAGGFLSTGPSRLRNQQLSVTLQGPRSSLSAQFSRSVTSRLGDNLNPGSDLANTSHIEQRSFSLSASHQLTPTSGISLIGSRQETAGDASSQSTQLTSLFANWNARFGMRLSGQLGARHSRFEGFTSYTENAVYASLTQQF